MRSVTTGFASLAFYGTTRLFWQDKWNSLPKIGGNLFGLYFRLNKKHFIYLQVLHYICPSPTQSSKYIRLFEMLENSVPIYEQTFSYINLLHMVFEKAAADVV